MDIGSLISSVVGLGTKIGTAIPGMKKPKRTDASSRAASNAATKIAKSATGAAQTGHGASRGLALRSGLRAATDAAKAASTEGQAANADERRYQEQKDARNANIASFGADLAKGLGDMAGAQIQAKRNKAGAGAEEGIMPGDHQYGTGVSQQPLLQDNSANLDDIEQGLNDQASVEQDADQQALIDAAGDQLTDFSQKREDAGIVKGGPTAAFQVDPTSQLIASMKPSVAPQIEQHLADRMHMKELALAEAERLGISLEVAIPRMNRRFQLLPGQSFANPTGQMSTDFDNSGDK